MATRYFILGNGGAALHGIRALRIAGFTGEVHQISDDRGPAFNPMVAPYFLSGKVGWETCFPFGEAFYQTYQIERHEAETVVSLDARSRQITTSIGGTFDYDKCLIATGARPVMPPVPGLQDSRFALSLREPETALNMVTPLQNAEKVLILGASFVGIKLAEVFLKKGIKVVLVDIAPQIMPQGALPEAAKHVETLLRQKGIDVRLGVAMKKVEDTADGAICHFPDGSIETVDCIAVSAGIKPNLDFLDPEQVRINRAICTNDRMQTSDNSIYAAGDVCEALNRLTNSQQWMGTWGNACYQGRVAGQNMAGQYAEYTGAIPQHVSPIFNWTYMQIGDALRQGPGVQQEFKGDPFTGDNSFTIRVFENDVLVGANLINAATELAGIKMEIISGIEAARHTTSEESYQRGA